MIPLPRLAKCAMLLSEEFQDLRVFRLTEPAWLQFKQVAVLGTRRKRHVRLTDSALLERVRCLEGLTLKPDLEPLSESTEYRYIVGGCEKAWLRSSARDLVAEANLILRGESDVGNKYAYFMKRQNHSGGVDETADAACNRNAYPNPACSSR